MSAVRTLPSGMARLSRRLISVQGPEAAKFLQGMVSAATTTRDHQPLPQTPGAAVYSGIFNPQGRLLHDIMLYPMAARDATQPTPDYLVEADGEQAATLLRLLTFYKLSAKVTLRPVEPGAWDVWQAWSDRHGTATANGPEGLGGDPVRDDGILSRDPRVPGLGWRWLGKDGRKPPLELEEASEDHYRLRRYLHGVAEGQKEMPREQALPMEYNMDIMGGIDFQKGCYVGQELQARTKYLGVVQKRVLPCILYPEDGPVPQTLEYDGHSESSRFPSAAADAIEPGTPIKSAAPTTRADGGQQQPAKREKRPGKWVAGMGNVGLAICKMAVMTDLVPPAPPRMALPQPTRHPDDEFEMALPGGGGTVKIRAFVPGWVRRALEIYHD